MEDKEDKNKTVDHNVVLCKRKNLKKPKRQRDKIKLSEDGQKEDVSVGPTRETKNKTRTKVTNETHAPTINSTLVNRNGNYSTPSRKFWVVLELVMVMLIKPSPKTRVIHLAINLNPNLFDMPIDNNKPLDPLIQEFCELTGMSSANMSHTVVGISSSRVKEGKPRRHRHGIKIKVSTHGSASAGAGSILKRLRSSKSGAIEPNLQFAVGSTSVVSSTLRSVDHDKNSNDGSFINDPIVKSPIVSTQSVPVAKSCGPETDMDLGGIGDVGNATDVHISSKDGMTCAKTSMDCDIAGPSVGVVQPSIGVVGNASVANSNVMDGIANGRGSSEFEFGKNNGAKGILKKPVVPLLSVQFGSNVMGNPFFKNSGKSGVNGWNSSEGNLFGPSLFHKLGNNNVWTAKNSGVRAVNADGSINVESFAEKMKKGMEDRELLMNYEPQCVSKQDNGTRRIQFSVDDNKSGAIEPNLQFAVGSTSVVSSTLRSVDHDKTNSNDGSFINDPIVKIPIVSTQSVPVAKSCGPETDMDLGGIGDVGNATDVHISSKDGMTCAKTGMDCDIAGPSVGVVQPSIGVVGNASVANSNVMDGIANGRGSSEFEFGKNDGAKGILKKPVVPLLSMQFGSNVMGNPFFKNFGKSGVNGWNSSEGNLFGPSLFHKLGNNNVWTAKNSGVKAVNADGSINDNGTRRIQFSVDDIKVGSEACSLQLYGYFVGTSMDYRIVNSNLSKMWRVYGIDGITKTSSGVFISNLRPGIWLEKVEASTIPIWVYVYNIPMELCNGASIGKIMSGIGKPMLMDKMTKERCLKKSGKLDFARVLVEVSANEDLPEVLEISYPPIGNRPARIGKLDVKYQWKPPCVLIARLLGTILLVGKGKSQVVDDNDSFVTVGKNNKPVYVHNNVSSSSQQSRSGAGNNAQVRGSQNVSRQSFGNSWQSKGRGNNKMGSSSGNNGKKDSTSQINDKVDKGINKAYVKNGSVSQANVKSTSVSQENFKPKVLVRGSSSYSAKDGFLVNDVPVTNSFEALASQTLEDKENEVIVSMEEEYSKVIEPRLMQEVIDVMESGVFPSLSTRMKWSLTQMDFFYNICHKYGLEPTFEEDDVASVDGDLANEMRPEYEVDGGQDQGNIGAKNSNHVSND
ncbi:hypothetical protein CTI12_AA077870 [Artemisia annua]|uniref:Uncharacterized protein n=1 Tax=Artemisia annua TaxID=35608 RepID=A0A2U1Q4D7_ARTAN|nr:hypothetical protein CTI12_AA077870 [Artemisia annua]